MPNDTIVDQVGMSAGSAYKEGTTLTPLTTTGTNQGYERKPGGASGSTQDTNNNANDFMVTAPSDPQDLASKPTPSSAAPQITNGPPPSPVIVGTPYSFSFTATGNPPPTFSFTGTLPPGLGLSACGRPLRHGHLRRHGNLPWHYRDCQQRHRADCHTKLRPNYCDPRDKLSGGLWAHRSRMPSTPSISTAME